MPESLHQKSRRDQQHESKQDFIGAGIELYSTCREHGNECDDGGGKHDKGNLRYQPMNGQHCIKSVLNGLKKILQEHRPAQDESHLRIQCSTDIRIYGSGYRIHVRHASKADCGDRHCDHANQKRRHGVSVRQYLRFTE